MFRPSRLILLACALLVGVPALALDPPHDASNSIDCGNCHVTHHAPGGAITKVAGNPNLCMSCHSVGGMAAGMAFADSDEAVPGSGGTSHRWDSGAGGWLKIDAANTSSGSVQSGGAFTAPRSAAYTIEIESAGDIGTATFRWTSSVPATSTYLDAFNAIAFNGSAGTRSWSATPWQESGEADGVAAGSLRVVANAACAAGNCLRIGGGALSGRALGRAAETSGAGSGMLRFRYRRLLATCPNTSTANTALQVSRDGVDWTSLAVYNLNACDPAEVDQAFDVTAYLGAAMQIRWLGSGTAGASDFLYVDDVSVETLGTAASVTGVVTGAGVPLEAGLTLTFANGAASPAFASGDRWTLFAHTDVRQPTMPALAVRLASGKITCSTCHNEHSQLAQPFDPDAPAYPAMGPGGEGRHHQRIDNDANQMCTDCHANRVVNDAALGSHPVGIPIPAGHYKTPDALPLDSAASAVQCMSCHQLHGAPSADGMLLRGANGNDPCTDCHTLADTATPASHLDGASGALWPGPQYGSDFPARTDPNRRGLCVNCHQPHGWPDDAHPGQDFPALLVNSEENLCYACHDGSPAATNVLLQFSKSYRHPTGDLSGRHDAAEGGSPTDYGTANRHAECGDCHDPHRAAGDAAAPTAPAASRRLAGVSRVAVTYGAAGSAPTFAFRGADDPAAPREYELCFKCHSSWTSQPAGQTDLAAKFNPNNPSFHPVVASGKNLNIRTQSFVNGWTPARTMYCSDCHTSDDPTVRGPHGSQNRYLLKRPFVASGGPRTTASTEECFDCHSFSTYGTTQSSDTVLAYSRFNRPNFEEGHSFHVAEKRAPCWACHDSHGSANKPHLVVTGRNPGLNSYTETATGGSCSPTCHSPENYTLNYPR